jgi:hypothetical protein
MKIFKTVLVAVLATSSAAWPQGNLGNPPPTARLGDFATFELRELERPALKEGAATVAADTLNNHLKEMITPILEGWKNAGSQGATRALVIQPEIVEMHFVGGKARFWGGALAGNSFVTLRLKLTDAATGESIGTPEFYQRANAMGGAWSVGKTDKDMLRRVATLATEYLTKNHDAAVGGFTGRE